MTIRKSISFFAPYIVNELNQHVDDLSGGDALLYGGEITVQTSSTVDIAPYIFVQGGVTVFQDEVTAGVTVPDYSSFTGPVHILISSPDSTDTSGITMSVSEGNEDIDDNAIVLASRTQNSWSNPPKPSLTELRKEALMSRADSSSGRVSDASAEFDDGYKGWGTNQAVHLKQGVVADSAGTQRVLDVDTSLGEPNSSLEFDITSVDPDSKRLDYIVARRVSDNLNVPPEIVYAKGDTFTGGDPVTISTASGSTVPSVAYNATGEHVVVYGNGTNLYHAKLDHTAARTLSVGPTATAAGGTVASVFLAERKDIQSGDRLYGCCVIGTELAVFRTTADGASIGVSDIHIFTSMSNTPAAPHMVVTGEGTTDKPLYAHIVFEHPEGSPNNQIYYTKYALSDATWGTAGAVAVEPRIARGFNSGADCTEPHMAVHPNGNLHIAYVHTATKAEIRYLVINQAGEVVEIEQALATGPNEINDGTGTAITIDDNCEQPKVAISPQGNVYVVWADASKTVVANEAVIAWEPTMLERTGFHAVVLFSKVSYGFGWHDVFSNDLGNLCWAGTLWGDSGEGAGSNFYLLKFNPILVGDGLNIDPDNLCKQLDTGYTDSTDYSFFANTLSGEAILDRDGGVSIVSYEEFLSTYRLYHARIPTASGIELHDDKKKQHPKDKYIARISIPSGVSNVISSASDVKVSPVKIKSLPPIKVIGRDGQEGTFSGLQDAIWSLRGIGGRILIKGGDYEFFKPLEVISGVEIIGDGHVVLNYTGYNAAITCQALNDSLTITEVDATRQIYSVSGGGYDNLLHYARIGDVGFIWDWSLRPIRTRSNLGTPFTITKILDNSTFQASRSLTSDITAAGGDGVARTVIYSTGVKIQNLTIYDNRYSANWQFIEIYKQYLGVFKDLHIIQTLSTENVARVYGGYGTRFENIIVDKAGTNACFVTSSGDNVYSFDMSLSHCAFRGDATLTGFIGLKVNGCLAENWTVTGTAYDAPVWTSNAGAISNTSLDTFSTWGDDASVFANRIILNEDAGFDTNGNVRGNLVPIDADSNVGNTTKKWKEVVTQTAIVSPDSGNAGLRLDGSSLNMHYNTEDLGQILDWDGDVVDEMDALGRWVGTNILEDDFQYLYGSWGSGGTFSTPVVNDPNHRYAISGTVGSSGYEVGPIAWTTAQYTTALRQVSAGAIVGTVGLGASCKLEGPATFSGSSINNGSRITFKAKVALGSTANPSVDGLIQRTDKIGLYNVATTSGTYEICFRYQVTSGPISFWYLVIDDGTEYSVGVPLASVTYDEWLILYLSIDSTGVYAWTHKADEIAERAQIVFDGTPAAPVDATLFSPFFSQQYTTTDTGDIKMLFVDYWCLYNNVLLR